MFPDNSHEVDSPKFFSLTLTDAYGVHTYLYNLKFAETYVLDKQTKIKIPLVISISSNKEDMEPFKEILYAIHQIIVNTDNNDKEYSPEIVNNYKKIELINLFEYCFTLLKPPPHSLLTLKLDSSLYNDTLEELNFYFCSYCEIPCNKNDQDINMLFSILDHSIIVKLIFSILTEKQIIIRASQAYVLHLIFPALLKLIFPFQWIHSYLPVVPSEQLELLEKPGSYLFGVLSSSISLNGIIEEFPGRVIVDCDTNEIIDNEIYYPPKKGEGLLQGKNTVIIEREKIYVLEGAKRKVGVKPNGNNKGNLIIDCSTDTVYIDKSNSYLTIDEWKSVKKKIQFIKNPETFGVENIAKKKCNKIIGIDNDDDFQILPDRSFSYNIQNIFFNLFLTKILYENSEFMQAFKQTNLYKIFRDPQKYQNDVGAFVIKNIKETQNNPRSFLNSFEVVYFMQGFPAKKMIDDIKDGSLDMEIKINNEKMQKDPKIEELEKSISKVLHDYCKVKGVFSDEFPIIEQKSSNTRLTTINMTNKKGGRISNASNNLNFSREKHMKNNTSLLAQAVGNKALFLMEKTNEENEFLFYDKKGFIKFGKALYEYFEHKDINIEKMIYIDRLISQVIRVIKNETDLLPNENEIKQNIMGEGNEKQKLNDIYRISEKNEKDESKDSGGSIRVSKNMSFNLNLDEAMEDNLFAFGNLDEPIGKDDVIDHHLQLYLFLASCLEEIKANNVYLTHFQSEVNDEVNINEIIINLYQNAYEFQDKRDFPFFIFYTFLNSLTFDEIDLLEIKEKNKELAEIFKKVKNDKREIDEKKKKNIRNNSDACAYKRNKPNSLTNRSSEKLSTMSSGTTSNFSLGNEKVPFSIVVETNNEHPFQTGIKQIKTFAEPVNKLVEPLPSNNSFNKKIVINNEKCFEAMAKPLSWNIMKECSQLMGLTFPSEESIKNLSPEEILEETYEKVNNVAIIELISELKEINLSKISKVKQRVSFWVNCFNYLCLFSIFYKRWNINSETDWRNFMKNVYFIIGQKEFNFNDMQYILFDRVIFFDSSYKPAQHVKDCSISSARKKCEKGEDIELSYFSLYIPTKELLGPKIVSEEDCDCVMPFRTTNYFTSFVGLDHNGCLHIPEFVLMVEPNFLHKSLSKYKNCLDSDIYEIIEKKQYKETIKTKLSWVMNFEYLLKQKYVQ